MAAEMKNLSDSEKKLHEYVSQGKIEEVKQVLNDSGVRVDCLDGSGMTCLMQAAFKGNPALCELLLARGADVNSNYHDSGYTALMFAALSGNTESTRIMLEAGAKTTVTNNIGRNAAQMAAFVAQHQCVNLINNFFSRDDLEYYTQPLGLEKEPKLPPALAPQLYKFILINNLCPVKLAIHLQRNSVLLDEYDKLRRLLEHLCEKTMKQKDTNEIMGVKFHYLAHVMKACGKEWQPHKDLNKFIKALLRGRDSDGFPVLQEQFIRTTLKDFPYMENTLIQQICRTIAPVTLGNEPTALNVMTSMINGQRMASEDDNQCNACMDFHSLKKCSACNMVMYCSQECQKLHWFQHKKYCKLLAVEYKRLEAQKKKDEAQRKKEEEEKKNSEEAQKKEELEKERRKLVEENMSKLKTEEDDIKEEKDNQASDAPTPESKAPTEC